MVSFLTFVTKEEVPVTHEELSLSDYTLFFRYYGGPAYAFTVESPLPVHKRITQRMLLVNSSSDCILKALTTKRSACLDYDSNGDYAMITNATLYASGKEALIRSKDTDLMMPGAHSFRKGSPIRESFDTIILNQLASGLFQYWWDSDWRQSKYEGAKWLRTQTHSPVKAKIDRILENENSGLRPLNFRSLEGIFVITLFGYLIGLVALVYELCHAYIGTVKSRHRILSV